MRALLDTHTFLWCITEDPRLSDRVHSIWENVENELLLSIASLWEIAIKSSLGKLALEASFDELFPRQLTLNQVRVLDIGVPHLAALVDLPWHHRDPFDRIGSLRSDRSQRRKEPPPPER